MYSFKSFSWNNNKIFISQCVWNISGQFQQYLSFSSYFVWPFLLASSIIDMRVPLANKSVTTTGVHIALSLGLCLFATSAPRTALGVLMDGLWRVMLRWSWSIVCDEHRGKPIFWNVIPCSAGAGWCHGFCGICWADFFPLETEIFPLLCVIRSMFIWEWRWHLWEPLCPHFTSCPAGSKAFDPWCTVTGCEKFTVYGLLAERLENYLGASRGKVYNGVIKNIN